jgi:hypothetical protein
MTLLPLKILRHHPWRIAHPSLDGSFSGARAPPTAS